MTFLKVRSRTQVRLATKLENVRAADPMDAGCLSVPNGEAIRQARFEMSCNLEPGLLMVPPNMVAVLHRLIGNYAKATGQTVDECRRLIEIAVLTRGVRMMEEEVQVQLKHAERMGWV